MPPRLNHEQRRAQILEAALSVFAERGFRGARTKEIARRAGVSETLIFRHFPSKEELYWAAFFHRHQPHPVGEEMAPFMAANDDRGVLRCLATHLLRHARRDPRLIAMLLFAGLEGMRPGEELRRRFLSPVETRPAQHLAAYIARRSAEGVFRPVNPQLAARVFLGAVMMHAAEPRLGALGGGLAMDDAEVVEGFCSLFLDGLRAT